MFKSALDSLNIKATTDDPQINFSYKGFDWIAKQLHPRETGPLILGKTHNSDLVIWRDDDYVAYVQVKQHAGDLHPDSSRDFVGRVIWGNAHDALMISIMSTINRWHLLSRYGIMNTGHILEAKDRNIQFRDWPKHTVTRFLTEQLGTSSTSKTRQLQKNSRKGKAANILTKHPNFNGVGFKFVQNSSKSYRLLTDGEYVAHSPHAIFRNSAGWFLVMKFDTIGISELYQTLATFTDLGIEHAILLTSPFGSSNAKALADEMGFQVASLAEIRSATGVDIDTLPIYNMRFTKYPLNTSTKVSWTALPDCVQKALDGVPDGIFETACLLANLGKALGLQFNRNNFVDRCWTKINEKWLGYEPAKTRKDTEGKVAGALSVVNGRHADPATIMASCDLPTMMGPKALDELYHLQLTSNCQHCKMDPFGDLLSSVRSQYSSQTKLTTF